jgi:hypothetical protein
MEWWNGGMTGGHQNDPTQEYQPRVPKAHCLAGCDRVVRIDLQDIPQIPI